MNDDLIGDDDGLEARLLPLLVPVLVLGLADAVVDMDVGVGHQCKLFVEQLVREKVLLNISR